MRAILLLAFVCTFAAVQSDEASVRQNRPLSSTKFDNITIDGNFDVFLTQTNGQSAPSVEIEAPPSVQSKIIVEIRDGSTLSVHTEGQFTTNSKINVYIKFPSPLRRYAVTGTGKTVTDAAGISNSDKDVFSVNIGGSVSLEMKVDVFQLDIIASGTASAQFSGQARELLNIHSNGVNKIDTLNLQTKIAKVSVTGLSEVRVAASEDADLETLGIGTIYYRLPAGKHPSRMSSIGIGKIAALP